MNKKTISAMAVMTLMVIGAGTVETMPLITVISIIGMMAAVKIGKLAE